MRHNSWLRQIVSIQDKGFKAFMAGVPLSDCPYQDGYRNQNGAGGSVQRQRRQAWQSGWEEAKRNSNDS